MRAIGFSLAMIFGFSPLLLPADQKSAPASPSHEQLQSVIEFLADDLLEGRAPATRGGELAEKYLLSLFKFMDLQPDTPQGFLQKFTAKGFTTTTVQLESDGAIYRYSDDIMGNYTGGEGDFSLEGEAVFAGFGIKADPWNWNDYKSGVKDKILILRATDPGFFIPNIFEGKTQTFYGRWTYKMEEAMRQGAKAVFIIHTPETANYGWTVVQNSWSHESLYLPSAIDGSLVFRGWIREECMKRLLAAKNINLDELYRKSLDRNFEPVPLGFNLRIAGHSVMRDVTTSNVVARIPGKCEKRIVLSAHIDHLGKSDKKDQDSIYNGAIDNGSAVAALVLTAKRLKEMEKDLYYGITILACEAEEQGLLGSRYYVGNTDRNNIILDINFESSPVWEKSSSFFAEGSRFLDIDRQLEEVSKKSGLKISHFSMVEQALYFRSDQFPFALKGIPGIWISAGEDFASGRDHIKEFFTGDYHKVTDEYHTDWELESLKQTVDVAVQLIEEFNRTKAVPHWKTGLAMPFPFENR